MLIYKLNLFLELNPKWLNAKCIHAHFEYLKDVPFLKKAKSIMLNSGNKILAPTDLFFLEVKENYSKF